ncbi:purine-nucleoside phosphorylase [Balneolaceae bacterium YR4-1]|uniref:Purine nucleoside phosphorylase n=1 Tax=Halalkalibaculum roseum TaxID=2709311 RepID=A0A6M1SLK2_9BACT|nr:purine-nucleoside phosphorylase [Halalkalibaculum roseum]NGP75879.1 purine-nucleoside phosphorylase [Halalkalibaculum roseum]
MSLPEFIDESVAYLKEQDIPENPEAAVILGSGLGSFGKSISDPLFINYEDIPHFPSTSVKGHDGRLISGTVNGKNIIAFSGRFHHYEGYDFEETAIPVYIAKALGVNKLIISNAAGAINTDFEVGDLMVIDSVMRHNKSISPMGYPQHRYNHYPLADKARKLAAGLGLAVQRGTYIYVTGPNYESKAEIRAFRKMGADAVGMSTAPELFEAARLRLKSVAISLISNMASGVTRDKLDHEEVKIAAESRKEDFAKLVSKLILEL